MVTSISTRKRNRQIISCLNCRQKKRKCDRLSPCSNCVKYRLEDSCTYASPGNNPSHSRNTGALTTRINVSGSSTGRNPWSSVNNELETLRNRLKEVESTVAIAASSEPQDKPSPVQVFKGANVSFNDIEDDYVGMNPIGSSTDALSFHCDFHDNYLFLSSRPLRLLGFMRKDPGAKLFWNYRGLKMPKSLISKVISDDNKLKSHDLIEQMKQKYGDAYIPALDEISDVKSVKKAINNFSVQSCLNYQLMDDDLNLYDKVKFLLPREEVLMKYLKYFFENLYCHYPILDEAEIRSELSRSVVFTNGVVTSLVVEKRQQIAFFATLLLILRISFLSLIKHNPYLERESQKDIIPIDYVATAESCLQQFDLTKSHNLAVLQSLIFLRIYRIYAPEEGDGLLGGNQKSFVGSLMSAAFALGLNRDPEAFVDMKSNEKTKHLRRKIWYFLLIEDLTGSSQFGTSLSADKLSYDTKFPSFTPQSSNVLNIEVEQRAVMYLEQFVYHYSPISEIVEIMSNAKTPIQITKLVEYVTELEISCSKLFTGGSNDINEGAVRDLGLLVIHMKIYIHSKAFLSFIYYCLFLYFENKGDFQLGYFYFRKSISIIFRDLKNISMQAWESFSMENGNAMLILVPCIEMYFYMVVVLSLILLTRLNATLIFLKKDSKYHRMFKEDGNVQDYVSCIEELCQLIFNFDRFQSEVSILSYSYYHAWKIFKLDKLFMGSVFSEEIYQVNETLAREAIIHFDLEMLAEMASILRENCISSNSVDHHPSANKLMRQIQLDNMWLQFNTLFRDQDAVPATFKDQRAPSNSEEVLDQTALSIFANDFNFFDDICFDDIIEPS